MKSVGFAVALALTVLVCQFFNPRYAAVVVQAAEVENGILNERVGRLLSSSVQELKALADDQRAKAETYKIKASSLRDEGFNNVRPPLLSRCGRGFTMNREEELQNMYTHRLFSHAEAHDLWAVQSEGYADAVEACTQFSLADEISTSILHASAAFYEQIPYVVEKLLLNAKIEELDWQKALLGYITNCLVEGEVNEAKISQANTVNAEIAAAKARKCENAAILDSFQQRLDELLAICTMAGSHAIDYYNMIKADTGVLIAERMVHLSDVALLAALEELGE